MKKTERWKKIMKTVYSIVLSNDVVEKIDRLAYENGTNRSNMINQILAEYVSYTTPEKRFREVFRQMQTILENSAFKAAEPSDTMLSLRSALAYKYNPTVKYNVELYRGDGAEIGELRVSLRTQNAGLVLYMTQFYRLWAQIETAYHGDITCMAADGKYTRKLALKNLNGVQSFDLGRVIASYVDVFDRALKSYFYHLETPKAAAAAVEGIYRDYLASNRILV
jgi:metal-responsive CopG/Arc/MetJ family transcriptional regulator